jgi:hypothetical protein
VALANEQLEVARNLPYSDVGIVAGWPIGKIPYQKTEIRHGANFVVTTTVRNIDDPFDGTIGGTPNDPSPADYKLVDLSLDCPNCKNFAPLKFTAGTNLTTAEAGAVEWNGTNLFLTTSGGVRQTINQGLTATATLDFPSTAVGAVSNLTVTVTGAALNDVVSLGVPNGSVPLTGDFSAWVSAANTVTVRYTNNSTTTAQDPAINTFKVFVTKF